MSDVTDEQLDDVIARIKEQMLTAREPKLIEAKAVKEKVKV
jgi:hypothetical protein